MSFFDGFFKLGDRVTKGDPLRKSHFDYCLYWIVFLAFVFLALTYYYSFFLGVGTISALIWGVILTVVCWFNYFALLAFRNVYLTMKEMKTRMSIPEKIEDVDEMLKEFE